MREIVLYVPRGGYPAIADIARGSAIVGELRAGAEVEIYFEGAIFGQENMRTLADRATHAAGRMLERYATTAARVVPGDALLAVGTFDLREGRVTLTGADSERAVAAWLGTLRLDPAELAQGARRAARAADVAHLVPDVTVTVNRSPGEALIERVGIKRDHEGLWVDGEERRTSAIAEGADLGTRRDRRGKLRQGRIVDRPARAAESALGAGGNDRRQLCFERH